jgi:hypothetical protein
VIEGVTIGAGAGGYQRRGEELQPSGRMARAEKAHRHLRWVRMERNIFFLSTRCTYGVAIAGDVRRGDLSASPRLDLPIPSRSLHH